MFTQVFHPCLAETMPNVLLAPLPVISNDNIQCLAPPLARVFRILMPVITLLRGSSSRCPHAGHHFTLRLVFTAEEYTERGNKICQKGE